jgi:hypothetical protein
MRRLHVCVIAMVAAAVLAGPSALAADVGPAAPAPEAAPKPCAAKRGRMCGTRDATVAGAAAGLVAATRSASARRGLRLASARRLFGRGAAGVLRRVDAAFLRGLTHAPTAVSSAAKLSGTSSSARTEAGGELREIDVADSAAQRGKTFQRRKLRLESSVESCPDPRPGDSHGASFVRGVAVYEIVTRVASGRRLITTGVRMRLDLSQAALTTPRADLWAITNFGKADRLTITSSQSVLGRGGEHESPSSTVAMELDALSPGTEVTFDNHSFGTFIEDTIAHDNGDPGTFRDGALAGKAYKTIARAFADMVGARVNALAKAAEAGWRTPGKCVKLTLDGRPPQLSPSATARISGTVAAVRQGVTETALLDLATFDANYVNARGNAVAVATLPLKPGVQWFDYTAPGTAWPALANPGLDVFFYSKGGLGRAPVTFPMTRFPLRFDGTWTRVFKMSSRPGWTETVHGTATFVRSSAFPPEAEGQTSIPYEVSTGSVDWTVSGSDTGTPGCTITYSGSGTAPATENSSGGVTELTLEDVSTKPDAPKPEPKPYYYSIQASGDPGNAPLFDISYSPDCHEADAQEGIAVNYLNVGVSDPFNSQTPPDRLEKSDNIHLLAGHRATDDGAGVATDDNWSFTGSNP